MNVRHILCEKQSKALEALQKIQVRLFYSSSSALIRACDQSYHRRANVSIRWPKSTPRTRLKVMAPILPIHALCPVSSLIVIPSWRELRLDGPRIHGGMYMVTISRLRDSLEANLLAS